MSSVNYHSQYARCDQYSIDRRKKVNATLNVLGQDIVSTFPKSAQEWKLVTLRTKCRFTFLVDMEDNIIYPKIKRIEDTMRYCIAIVLYLFRWQPTPLEGNDKTTIRIMIFLFDSFQSVLVYIEPFGRDTEGFVFAFSSDIIPVFNVSIINLVAPTSL
ncbi:hypothetical protein L204_103585 [Cryptococcus depauperatus]